MYFNEVEFELPKKTMALQKKIDGVNNATSTERAYTNVMEFLTQGLGKEKVEELLETSDLYKVDLVQMMLLYNSIIMEYENIIQKPQLERVQDIIKDMKLDSLVDASKLMK